MHILIAFITALASLLYALDRFGIDIGWLNPWGWRRRRAWSKQYHANPAFSLESPMDAIALLLTATAKIDGDLSMEEKNELRRIFEQTFKQSSSDASALLSSSTYLLGSGQEIFKRPKDVLETSLGKFSEEQKASSLDLLKQISLIGGPPSESQTNFISQIENILSGKNLKENW